MTETPNDVQYNSDDSVPYGAMSGANFDDNPILKNLVRSAALNVVQGIDNDELREQLKFDKKTGLYNESHWKNSVTEELEKLGPDETLTVQVSDVNGFKQVNDKLGHPAGDELLKLIGQAYSAVFKRKGDISAHGSRENGDSSSVARLGGDEFANMYINNTNGQRQIRSKEDAMKEAVEQSNRVNSTLTNILAGTKFADFNISLSIGSAISEPGDTVESIFARADADMLNIKYAAKRGHLTEEDFVKLRVEIPHIMSVGARVDSWLYDAVFPKNDIATEDNEGKQNHEQEIS